MRTLVAATLAATVRADGPVPHPHTGTLKKFEHAAPSRFGLSLKGVKDADLRQGHPIVRSLRGTQRYMSVQDMQCSEQIVWRTVMDLDRYPKMVPGVTHCEPYRRSRTISGGQVVCARYRVWSGFPLEYFLKHSFEPLKRCMTFHLDYERKSQLSDMVGYWYVEPLADDWTRVYFSSDSAVPYWLPPTAKSFMLKTVQTKNLAWVEKRCNEITGVGSRSRAALRRRVALGGAIAVGTWRWRAVTADRRATQE